MVAAVGMFKIRSCYLFSKLALACVCWCFEIVCR